jgi:hypothetical protein
MADGLEAAYLSVRETARKREEAEAWEHIHTGDADSR